MRSILCITDEIEQKHPNYDHFGIFPNRYFPNATYHEKSMVEV